MPYIRNNSENLIYNSTNDTYNLAAQGPTVYVDLYGRILKYNGNIIGPSVSQ